MDNKVLSIAIGEYKTKISVMNYKKKHPKVYQTLQFDTPAGCIEDGFIQDRDTLVKVIHNKLAEENINITDAVFTISSSKIATHEVVIPMVSKRSIQEYVNAGASDYFPINVADYVISYIILEKLQVKQQKNYRLLVIATNNNLLLSYFELAKALRLNIISIDYLINSILQLLQKQVYHRESCICVQINESNTLLYIFNQGTLKLHRTIACGSQTSIEILMSSMIRVIEYYTAKNLGSPIQMMYLTGTGARTDGIRDLFQNEFGIRVKLMNQLGGIKFRQEALPDGCVQSDFLDCIGASIAPLGIVPKQYLERIEKKSNLKQIVEISALTLAFSLVLVTVSFVSVFNAGKERMKLKQSITDLEKVEKIYDKNEKLTEKLDLLKAIDKSCDSNTENLNYLLGEFKKKLPQSTEIRSLHVSDTDIIMDVCTDSTDAAAMTFIQIESISLLTDVNTEKITEEKDKYGATKINCIITAKYVSQDSGEQEIEN